MDEVGAIFVVALLAAIVVASFWKEILGLLMILFLAVVFAGIFGIIDIASQLNYG